ncbi:hypothetical protein Ga0100231_011580 [Opitutaceae bacterium TAV4]|nr:hypothetical protein Ga0100231_011580 [Opitutaceae bacterium TAV4]RRJ99106.1 hypothetical protein Ga0100230_012745 [Opitutaceae bacterium TAV3]
MKTTCLLPTSRNIAAKAAIVVIALALIALHARAALAITDADIKDGRFLYSLTGSDLSSTSTKFANDVWASTNVVVKQQGEGDAERRFLMAATGETSASFTYEFDFSGTAYVIESFSIKDPLQAAYSASNRYTISSQWRTDSSDWIDLRSISTVGQTTSQSFSGTDTISKTALEALGQLPTTIYYRVTYTANTGTFQTNHAQASRTAVASTGLNVSFNLTAIPEPSTIAMCVAFGGACLGVIILRQRNRHQATR